MLLCLPIQVKNKFYPVVLALIFMLVTNDRFDILVGILVGFFSKYVDSVDANILNETRMKSWEQGPLFAWLKTLNCFIGFGGLSTHLISDDSRLDNSHEQPKGSPTKGAMNSPNKKEMNVSQLDSSPTRPPKDDQNENYRKLVGEDIEDLDKK